MDSVKLLIFTLNPFPDENISDLVSTSILTEKQVCATYTNISPYRLSKATTILVQSASRQKNIPIAFSKTSPGFYVSAVKVF